ncbi:MAG: tetratricopeptide repeat-containing sulfotransferase family protein [Alcanivoracaceae bacterium]
MKPANPDLKQMFHHAARLEAGGDTTSAERVYTEILKRDKRNAEAMTLMGLLAVQSNRPFQGLAWFEKALAVRKNDPGLHNNMAMLYLHLHRPDLAEHHASISAKLKSGNAETCHILSKCYYQLGKTERALKSIDMALAITPDNEAYQIDRAQYLDAGQRPEESLESFRRVLREGSSSVYAYDGIARARTWQQEPQEYGDILKHLEDPATPEKAKTWLHRAAGKIDHDLERYEAAFLHFTRSKKTAIGKSRIEQFTRHVETIKSTITKDFIRSHANDGIHSQRPIFIFGMPRSGTTLVEQILASHPDVAGANELGYFRMAATRLGYFSVNSEEAAASLLSTRRSAIQQIGREYLRLLTAYSPSARHVTDKMPLNSEILWLLAATFPKAIFIECKRDPLANCISCYIQPLGDQYGYSEDLVSIGRYYQLHEQLMSHWKDVLSVQIYTVQYEDLISNQEATTRSLLQHVGIPWHQDCLAFHRTHRAIRTPSRRQVASPLYSSANAALEPYHRFVTPLAQVLESRQ